MKFKLIIGLVLFLAGLSLGRFSSPAKVEIQEVERIVVKEVEVEKKDVRTVVTEREETKPDGTVVKDTTTTIEDRTVKDTHSDIEHSRELVKITTSRPDWRFSVSYGPEIPGVQRSLFRGGVERRILGEIYLGVNVSTSREIAASLSIGF